MYLVSFSASRYVGRFESGAGACQSLTRANTVCTTTTGAVHFHNAAIWDASGFVHAALSGKFDLALVHIVDLTHGIVIFDSFPF